MISRFSFLKYNTLQPSSEFLANIALVNSLCSSHLMAQFITLSINGVQNKSRCSHCSFAFVILNAMDVSELRFIHKALMLFILCYNAMATAPFGTDDKMCLGAFQVWSNSRLSGCRAMMNMLEIKCCLGSWKSGRHTFCTPL